MKNPCHCRGKLFRYQFTPMNKTLINPLNLLHEIIPVFTSVHCARPVLNNKRSRRGKDTFITRTGVNSAALTPGLALVFRSAATARTFGGPRGAPGVLERRPCWRAAPAEGRRRRSAPGRVSECESDVKGESGKKGEPGGSAPLARVTCYSQNARSRDPLPRHS